ncbi:hypothetical protein MKW94_022883, partial [Papaver nudicaule]|nr:hypothetical protein [Papaver nudicaule]
KKAEGAKTGNEEETALTKNKSQKRKMGHRYYTRQASKAVRENTNFEAESLTVQQRAKKEQSKLVPLSIKEGFKTHSSTSDSYPTMTVERLHALLKERGLMVKGKKDELIARLRGFQDTTDIARVASISTDQATSSGDSGLVQSGKNK